MPQLTVEQLREELRQYRIAPVYVLYGPETYLRDIAARTIVDRSFSETDFRDFNDTEFSIAESDTIQSALAAAEQLPMLSAKRVVCITDVRVASSAAKDTIKEEHEMALVKYLQRPAETTVLIFIAGELNGSRRMGKILREQTVSVEFAPLRDAELIRYAREKIREVSSEIDERTLQQLISRIGPDVRRLTNEIKKLSTAALPEKVISAALIESLVMHTRELSNFELTDHLISGRKVRALESLKKILDDGVEPLALLGLIASNYRRMLAAKDLMDSGADRSTVASVAKMPTREMENFLAAARRAEASRLARTMVRLAETDVLIKTSIGGSGAAASRMQLEMLVCEITAA